MATFSVSSLYQWPRHCTPKAREIVLNIVNSSQTPLATKDIYKLAIKPSRIGPAPHAGEEIRSIRYLKTVVLRDLAAQNRVEKFRAQGAAYAAWLWRPKQAPPPTTSSKSRAATTPPSVSGPTELLSPAAVGVGEDWSHLNKRRRRARKMKVEKDLQWMLHAQKMQRKGRATT